MPDQNLYAFVAGPNGFTLFANGKNYTVNKDNPNYASALDAVRAKDWDEVERLLNITQTVTNWLNGEQGFEVSGGLVKLDGEAFSEAVSEKVLRMISENFDANPMLRFLRKVRSNPSYSAQAELLLFCVANGFAITDDGDIIAYKKVRDDFKDMYTGTFDNSVGRTVAMPRHQVDDRRDVTCSRGLHFAAYDYACNSYYGGQGKIVAVKVNPADVVSIPSDYRNQKGRCSKYTVVAEMPQRQPLPQREVYAASDVGRDSWFDPDEDDIDDEFLEDAEQL